MFTYVLPLGLSGLLPFVPLKVLHCQAANKESTSPRISASRSGAPVPNTTVLSPQLNHANEKERKKTDIISIYGIMAP